MTLISGIRSCKRVALGAVFTALFACSSEKVNQPKELVPLSYAVSIEREWKTGAGNGDEELALELRPVLNNGKFYVIDSEGLLTIVDAKSGGRDWERELEESVSGGLGLDKDQVYYTTFQGDLVALDRNNGNEVWRRSLSSEAIAAPLAVRGRVLVQTIDGKVIAFDAAEGQKLWQNDSADPILSLRGTAQPQVFEDLVIAAFANGELKAFSLGDGRIRWRVSVGIAQGRTELERLVDVDGDPVLAEGVVYALAYQGDLLAIDARTGRELWRKPASSFKSMAYANETLYASLADGAVAAFSAESGAELWRNEELMYRRLSKPVIVLDYVLIADFEGYVHALKTNDGSLIGRAQPDRDGIMENIIAAGPRFFLLSRSGDLIAYTLGQEGPAAVSARNASHRRKEDF